MSREAGAHGLRREFVAKTQTDQAGRWRFSAASGTRPLPKWRHGWILWLRDRGRCVGMPQRVGVRKLRDRLSEYLGRVKAGECLEVTDRGELIAIITPAARKHVVDQGILAMVQTGEAAWSGGKPRGAERRPKLPGRPLSQLALEDRR